MKPIILIFTLVITLTSNASAQKVNSADVPVSVKVALTKQYPKAHKVTWEKEKSNFEANWGGKSGEDISVQLTPEGNFVEQVLAIPVSELPAEIGIYVKDHYKGAKITEAGKVTNSKGVRMFEAEVNGKDLLFDENGKFLKKD